MRIKAEILENENFPVVNGVLTDSTGSKE